MVAADIPPPPYDDPSQTNPLDCPPLRWGILGCGRVSHDFCQALKHIKSATVVACAAAQDIDRAKSFGERHNILRAYGSYEECVQDSTVEVVYVGNIHSMRRSVGELCLLANKHCVLEKPLACKGDDAFFLINLAKKRNLFLLEGLWTRFFPAIEQARRLVFGTERIIGEVVNVVSDFSFNASDSEEYPTSFLYNRKLGGGASLLVGPYPISTALLFFPNAEPDNVKVTGQVDPTTGVDLQAAIIMSFPATSTIQPVLDKSNGDENTPKLPGSGLACLCYGMLGESEERTTVVGTKGRLTIEAPFHCPTRLTVSLKASGRGNAAAQYEYNFPLPEDTEEIKKAGGYNYPNSAGFCYEAAAVARCIAAGRIEAPQFTLSETMITMKIIDQARLQLGCKAVDED